MNDPIPISREPTDPPMTNEEFMALLKQRHEQRVQWAFLIILALIGGAFLLPLIVWLTRLASGG